MYTHTKDTLMGGNAIQEAGKVLIMLHGRGATAESILSLSNYLNMDNTSIIAPKASGNSWYPYSFMSPVQRNQPALNSALSVVDNIIKDILQYGINLNQIFLLGFSQGACLALEYAARNAASYGGIVAFTGGLIGEHLNKSLYQGDFRNTPVLITTGDPDPHVPLSRVEESVSVLTAMNAQVTLKVYKGRPHTIQMEELKLADDLLSK